MKQKIQLIFKLLRFVYPLLLFHSVYTFSLKVDSLPEIYQDVLINGKIHKKGCRAACAHRYNEIKQIISTIQGPITVLDIGASQGYFSLRIAKDFPNAKVFMVEGGNTRKSDALLEICELNNKLENITLFSKKINSSDIEYLLKNEHFTVVLGLNVLYFLPEDSWDALTQLGDVVFLEAPQNMKEAFNYISNLNGKFLLESDTKHPNYWAHSFLYCINNRKSSSFSIKTNLKKETLLRLNQVYPTL